MHKISISILASVTFLALISASPARSSGVSQFISPPLAPPVRGVVTPLVQLSPTGAFDMFASDLRQSLQEGIIPDVSLFVRFEQVYDKRHYGFYPDFLAAALDHYKKSVLDYCYTAQKLGTSTVQLNAVVKIMETTSNQVTRLVFASKDALAQRIYNEKTAFDKAVSIAYYQIAQYKGNPTTLTMPLSLFSELRPGDAYPRQHASRESSLATLANAQLKRVGDRLGSGTPRSNQWILVLRHHRQGMMNTDALAKSFAPNSYSTQAIADY